MTLDTFWHMISNWPDCKCYPVKEYTNEIE